MQNLSFKSSNEQSYLLSLIHGPIRWQLLQLALELKIFDLSLVPISATKLSAQYNFGLKNMRIFLNGLVSMGLLKKIGESYQTSPEYALFLASEASRSMRETLLHFGKVKLCSNEQILEILLNVKSEHISVDFSEAQFWGKAVDNLRSFHKSCSCDVYISILNTIPEWHRVNKFLDFAAGSEHLAFRLLSEKPGLAVSIFDLPPCAERIEQALVEKKNISISVQAGDYNIDLPIGNNDLIWTSMSLYYAWDLTQVIKNLHNALTDKGILVCLHEGLTQERTKPEYHVIGRLIPALNGNDVSFNSGDIANAMRIAGFRQVISRSIQTPFGPMELDIGYR